MARHTSRDGERLVVRCSKAQAKERGLTYAEALEEALCFGWIDGVRRSVDAESFSVRFIWVMEAKREETRARRFATLLECSSKGQRIPLLRREGRAESS
jgi:uncharacterized protein YdeI (YjbR/CyaY-like superfamily)